MRSRYDGVKFYSANDWSIGENLERAAVILDSFDANEEYTDINQIIELYNIQELIVVSALKNGMKRVLTIINN